MNEINPSAAETAAAEETAKALAAAADTLFNPVEFLCSELERAGSTDLTCWMKHIDPRATTEPDEMARIFFANRALRLYMAEQEGRNHMEARLLLADGIPVADWKSIVSKGVVPWILNKLPVNKKQLAAAAAAVSDHRTMEAVAVADQAMQPAEESEVSSGDPIDPEAYGAPTSDEPAPSAAPTEDGGMNSLDSVQE